MVNPQMTEPNNNPAERFGFLHSHMIREAHILEILQEIHGAQSDYLSGNSPSLSTLESIKNSREIRMPVSPSRDKNISYLVDQLLKNYPDQVRTVVSFRFNVAPTTRKLSIDKQLEFTVRMSNDDYGRIQSERDESSVQSLLSLLSQFRLFNLSKLIKNSPDRVYISRLIKLELGKNIFTYKHYSLDKNLFEVSEDYCFHRQNYEAVRERINTDELQSIIQKHHSVIERRLKKFGILNTAFTDYRDSKVDYLLNIIIDEIFASLDKKDAVEIKNFASLRECILKVEKIIDPLITLSDDIARYIREFAICRDDDLSEIFPELDRKMISKWARETAPAKKIVPHVNGDGVHYLMDGEKLVARFNLFMTKLSRDMSGEARLTQGEKEECADQLAILYGAGCELLKSPEKASPLIGGANIQKLRLLKNEYEQWKRAVEEKMSISFDDIDSHPEGIVSRIVHALKSIFGSKRKKTQIPVKKNSSPAKKVKFSRETEDIRAAALSIKAPIFPVSELIDITPENQNTIDKLINELRSSGLKIVIPVYNSRTVLYPRKSQEILMADIEYLIAEPDAAESLESIREYVEKIAGSKLKDEQLPGRGIVTIENYLLALYRQKKARKRR